MSVVRDGAGHKALCATKSLQQQLYSNNVNNNVNNNTNNQRNSDCGGLPAQLRRQQLMRLGGTVDGSCSRGRSCTVTQASPQGDLVQMTTGTTVFMLALLSDMYSYVAGECDDRDDCVNISVAVRYAQLCPW